VYVVIKIDAPFLNDSLLPHAYTNYNHKKDYVTKINNGIAVCIPIDIYSKIDTIEIKYQNPKEKLRFVKLKEK
ncbi:MAG: hypothetical protein LBT29_00065, partial [Flavobacteriaceae bacterium]|nr:hypothetical protein [Flavobacteriaceae bacterium]